MNGWVSKWVKKNYPIAKSDLCTCFMSRGMVLSASRGYFAMVTSQTWMFITSFEKLRKQLLESTAILTLCDTKSTGLHADNFTANAAFSVYNRRLERYEGSYFKLNQPIEQKSERLLEALADPGCGWFYRADADGFGVIPGSPIAYWASKNALRSFKGGKTLSKCAKPRSGFSTGDNERFIHFWWEVERRDTKTDCFNLQEADDAAEYWFPLNKGGGYRKWYGNNIYIVEWKNKAAEMKRCAGYRSGCESEYFKQGITWGSISSAVLSVRFSPEGFMPNRKGAMAFSTSLEDSLYCLGLLNSSTTLYFLRFLAPTLDFSEGPIGSVPLIRLKNTGAEKLANSSVNLARQDFDSFEESWDFKRHPLI